MNYKTAYLVFKIGVHEPFEVVFDEWKKEIMDEIFDELYTPYFIRDILPYLNPARFPNYSDKILVEMFDELNEL